MPRPYQQDPESKEFYLPLGRSGRVLMDLEDAQHFCQWSWRSSSRGEPKTSRPVGGGKYKDTYLHREVAGRMGLLLTDREITYVNGDKLDCRRQNLQTRLVGQHTELRPYLMEPFSGTALFQLTQGHQTVVDLEDATYLAQWNWTHNHGYAERVQVEGARQTRISMAHEVVSRMGLIRGDLLVDHINTCRTDNRRSNLRLATHTQNVLNRRLNAANTSGVKGVSWSTNKGKWVAQISINKRKVHLGYFLDRDEATRVYREAVAEHFGEFGRVE